MRATLFLAARSTQGYRSWLKPENRCLVPANSFAEYAPEPNPETNKKELALIGINAPALRAKRNRIIVAMMEPNAHDLTNQGGRPLKRYILGFP
jgi:putative SOS response-associated peptidase YedK